MALEKEQVRHVAQLSRLNLSDAEEEMYAQQLGDILEYIDTLNELDTEGVEPMVSGIDGKNVFRKDELKESLPNDLAIGQSASSGNGFFKVPKVID